MINSPNSGNFDRDRSNPANGLVVISDYFPVHLEPLDAVAKLLFLFILFCFSSSVALAKPVSIPILYLQQEIPRPAVLSNIIPPPVDEGLRGAELGVSDNNTTGRFLQHDYRLESLVSQQPEMLVDRALDWVKRGNGFVIANLPATTLLSLADHPQLKGRIILFNTGSADDRLRLTACRTGLLHTLPSRAMLTDALAQFLIRKRWNRWLLIQGQNAEDALYSQSLERAAKRFGGAIVATKTWTFETDLRRAAQQEIPAFTQTKEYQVTLVADESGDVGEYIPYNTWLPRPVAGTQGLTPVAWHRVIEQWGASQLQRRFEKHAQRWMTSEDYAAWLAVRIVGEAVTRNNSIVAADLYQYLLSEQFEIAAFKGRKLSFRNWNGQLRQPIALVHPRALVSQSPQEGFLHPRTDLDTLGFDKPEVHCAFAPTLEDS